MPADSAPPLNIMGRPPTKEKANESLDAAKLAERLRREAQVQVDMISLIASETVVIGNAEDLLYKILYLE